VHSGTDRRRTNSQELVGDTLLRNTSLLLCQAQGIQNERLQKQSFLKQFKNEKLTYKFNNIILIINTPGGVLTDGDSTEALLSSSAKMPAPKRSRESQASGLESKRPKPLPGKRSILLTSPTHASATVPSELANPSARVLEHRLLASWGDYDAREWREGCQGG
jgi:hypothetical protein